MFGWAQEVILALQLYGLVNADLVEGVDFHAFKGTESYLGDLLSIIVFSLGKLMIDNNIT